MISVSIQVTGKVQDVWYRKYTCDKAIELGLKGEVQNLDDGSVLIHASGSQIQINQLTEWCWQGSPLSDVTEVKIATLENATFPDFRIVE